MSAKLSDAVDELCTHLAVLRKSPHGATNNGTTRLVHLYSNVEVAAIEAGAELPPPLYEAEIKNNSPANLNFPNKDAGREFERKLRSLAGAVSTT